MISKIPVFQSPRTHLGPSEIARSPDQPKNFTSSPAPFPYPPTPPSLLPVTNSSLDGRALADIMTTSNALPPPPQGRGGDLHGSGGPFCSPRMSHPRTYLHAQSLCRGGTSEEASQPAGSQIPGRNRSPDCGDRWARGGAVEEKVRANNTTLLLWRNDARRWLRKRRVALPGSIGY